MVAWVSVSSLGGECHPGRMLKRRCLYSYKYGVEPEDIHFSYFFLKGLEFKYMVLFEYILFNVRCLEIKWDLLVSYYFH